MFTEPFNFSRELNSTRTPKGVETGGSLVNEEMTITLKIWIKSTDQIKQPHPRISFDRLTLATNSNSDTLMKNGLWIKIWNGQEIWKLHNFSVHNFFTASAMILLSS